MENIDKYINEVKKTHKRNINKEELCKIAHISKKTAKFLLDNKIIPAINTGKKTHSYKIKLEEVIKYLKNRELEPFRFKVANLKKRKGLRDERNGFMLMQEIYNLNADEIDEAKTYLTNSLECYADLMTVKEISNLLGYEYNTIIKYCRCGNFKTFKVNNKYLIPKVAVIDFILCITENDSGYKSYRHLEWIKKVLDAVKDENK